MMKNLAIFVLIVSILIIPPLCFHGDSMEPTIYVGDYFIFLPATNYNVGDVIVFYSNDYNGLTVHRITDKFETTYDHSWRYETRGDNTPVSDRLYITNNQILGKINIILPFSFNRLGVVK